MHETTATRRIIEWNATAAIFRSCSQGKENKRRGGGSAHVQRVERERLSKIDFHLQLRLV